MDGKAQAERGRLEKAKQQVEKAKNALERVTKALEEFEANPPTDCDVQSKSAEDILCEPEAPSDVLDKEYRVYTGPDDRKFLVAWKKSVEIERARVIEHRHAADAADAEPEAPGRRSGLCGRRGVIYRLRDAGRRRDAHAGSKRTPSIL